MALGSSGYGKTTVVFLTFSLAICTAYLLWSNLASVVIESEVSGVRQPDNARLRERPVLGKSHRAFQPPSESTLPKPMPPPRTNEGSGCEKRLPGAIVIGVMKCGTYALKSFLHHHPDIAMRIDEMVNFFTFSNQHPDLEAYRDMMACSTPGQLTMEGSPGYYPEIVAPGLIKIALPKVKLILILRDPVNRAVSEYLHLMDMENKMGPRPNMYKPMPQIKEGCRSEIAPSFEEAVSYSNGSLKTYNLILAKGCYADFLPRWFSQFPRQRFLILDGDAFARDPLPQLKLAERFLDIRPFFTRRHFKYNKEKGFYCFNFKEARKNQACLGGTKGRPHPLINATLLRTLHRYYAPFNRKLNKLLNRTFRWSDASQDVA
ncbi:heparan sulfate glucosamine 3-O-sulfotransferase 1-like [Acanthaster planci]|uniref:Heparan sulfate glucosamine 3-O-sulfotransferase 1-like n=1 Tax=Acanthaster planci TaxID=133434 RepID=A0A8B7Y4G0_ACAPL|nr:heparan sulfate glucosamine 3-O-sulfotransferase 1-like [Acanthaster planci]